MKKVFSIIALCMAIILCIPAVPALAYDGGLFLVSPTTYNLYEDTVLIKSCKYLYGDGLNSTNENIFTSGYYNGFKNSLDTVIDGEDIIILSSVNTNSSVTIVKFNGITNGRIMCFARYGFNDYGLTHYCVISDTAFTYQYFSIDGQNNNFSVGTLSSEFQSALCEINGTSFYIATNKQDFVTTNNSHSEIVVSNTGNGYASLSYRDFSYFRYSDYPIYSIYEDATISKSSNMHYIFSGMSNALVSGFDYTNLIGHVNAFTSNGMENDYNTGIGEPSFSFADTSYNGGIAFNYQQTHLYTQYNNAQGANETCVFKWALDERSRSITQTTSDWLMHYYVIVYWHWTQATDSSVYTPLLSGGSGGSMAFEFDAEPDFIMQGQTEISIWDLVQHVPTISSVSDEDIVSLAVAVSCLNGNIVNSVWRDIFGQSGQYVGDVASEIISGGKLEVQGVGEFGGSFINNLFNPAYYYALDDLRIKLVAHPWSGSKNIHGGNGDFDLNLRSNDSYGTTQGYVDDGGTPDDPTDDTQYPTNTVPQQNNVVVPVTYPTSGGNVTVYSVVQVPDSGGGGGNSINYSPTFSPSIVMDSGLDDLKETVDAYPQVPNQHFWDYFLVFKDNAFLDATSDFFGALPNELSSLLISSIGIIGVFAIYRFVRRR